MLKVGCHTVTVIGLVFTTSAYTPAGAQSAGSDTAASVDTPTVSAKRPQVNDNSASDIIVTATKRPENVERVPLSVSVVSQDTIQALNITTTADLVRAIPGVTYSASSSPALAVFNIRGVGTYATGGGVERSVGIAVDGVPLGRPSGSIADLIDIADVEVLKGPQGMLFGKNATAGLINIITQKPKLGVTELVGHTSYATGNNLQVSTTANVSAGDDFAIRATGWKSQRDGIVDQFQTGRELSNKNSRGARLKALWNPTNKLSLMFTGEWTGHSDLGTAVTIRNFVPSNFTASNAGAIIQAYEKSVGTVAGPSNSRSSSIVGSSDKDHVNAYTAQGDYSLDGATITGILSRRSTRTQLVQEPSASGTPILGGQTNNDDIKYNQTTAELRISSASDYRVRYTAGLFYFNLKYGEIFEYNAEGTVPAPVHTTSDLLFRNRNYAAFGEIDGDVTSRLHVLGGLRLAHDDTSGSIDRSYIGTPVIIPTFNGTGTAFGPLSSSTSTKYTNLSGRGGARYDVAHDVMAYATYSRGYKGPGVTYGATSSASQIAATNGIVKAETVAAVEVGLKSRFFDRHLTLNVAAYNQVYNNFQASVRLPSAAFVTSVASAKQLKSTGVDVDFVANLVPDFSLSGAAQYNHARYTNFTNAVCYPNQTAAQGCVKNVQSLNGKPLQNAPRWSGNFTAHYEHKLLNDFTGAAELNYTYRSKVVYNTVADPNEAQNGYGIFNINFTLKKNDGSYGVRLFMNNVLAKNFVDRVAVQDSGSYYVNYNSYEAQRVIGAELNFKL